MNVKSFISSLKNLSVTWKFIFAYSSVIIIPIAIIAMYLYFQTSATAITQAKMLMEQNVLETKSSILQQVKIIENMSHIVSSDEKLETFLKNKFVQDAYGIEDYKFNIISFVDNISRQNKDIYTMRVYMNNPTIPEIYDDFYNINRVENKSWYKEFIKTYSTHFLWRTSHEPSVYSQQHIDVHNQKVFSFCSKIYSLTDNDMVGLLEIEMKENVLFGVLRSPIINKLGNVFVVDKEGVVVSDNKPAYYMKKLEFKDQKTALAGTFNEVKDIKGIKSIVISVPADEIGCNIVGVFPVKNFTGRVKTLIPIIVAASLLAVLFLGLLVYFITNALLRRIKTLVKAMKQVRDGNLNVSIEVHSKDEFSELALSFNNMTRRINDLVETVYKIQLLEREAELRALEVQINPHFLYNTLATISWAARKVNSKEIYKISNSLAKFYRLVLSKGNTLIRVKEEVDMVKAYLEIQKIRFEDLFDISYEIDELVYDYYIVKNILQPLIENALNHGIQPKGGHGVIALKVFTSEDKLVFEVIDDGVGMDSNTIRELLEGNIKREDGSGYAVKNIMERLKAYYGTGHIFDIDSNLGTGTRISIKINLEKVG